MNVVLRLVPGLATVVGVLWIVYQFVVRTWPKKSVAKMETLAEAEARAQDALAPRLQKHLALASDAFDLIGFLLAHHPDAPMSALPKAMHVAVKLLLRLSNDLRGVQLHAERGYPLQALTVCASMYEIAYALGYIGPDETLAQKWLDHDSPARQFRSVKEMTRVTLERLGVTDPETVRHRYRTYQQLCLAKHANPLLESRYGIEVRGDQVVSMNGPDTSETAVRAAMFALEHAAGLAFIAVAISLQSHFRSYMSNEIYTRLAGRTADIGARREELEAAAVARWGNDEPFPGRW